MGEITQKDIDALPKAEKKKVDNAKKEIVESMPKKVKKTEDKPKKVKEEIDLKKLREDLDKLGDWIADVDDELGQVIDLVNRMATRLGIE